MSNAPLLSAQELQSLRNLGNESERAADEIAELRAKLAGYVPVIERPPRVTAITEMQRLMDLCVEQGKEIERLRELLAETSGYLVAASAGSMSRNNSEQLASELLGKIDAARKGVEGE